MIDIFYYNRTIVTRNREIIIFFYLILHVQLDGVDYPSHTSPLQISISFLSSIRNSSTFILLSIPSIHIFLGHSLPILPWTFYTVISITTLTLNQISWWHVQNRHLSLFALIFPTTNEFLYTFFYVLLCTHLYSILSSCSPYIHK